MTTFDFYKLIKKEPMMECRMTDKVNRIPKHLAFFSLEELNIFEQQVTFCKDNLNAAYILKILSLIPGVGLLIPGSSPGEVGYNAIESMDVINELQGKDNIIPPPFGTLITVFQALMSVGGYSGLKSYLTGLELAVKEEISKRGDEDPYMGYFRQAAWREVEFSARAWKFYKALAESRIINVCIGLDDTTKGMVRKEYFEEFESFKDPYSAVMATNRIFVDDLKNKPAQSLPERNNQTDFISMDTFKDVLAEYLGLPMCFIGDVGKVGEGSSTTTLPKQDENIIYGSQGEYRGFRSFPWEGRSDNESFDNSWQFKTQKEGMDYLRSTGQFRSEVHSQTPETRESYPSEGGNGFYLPGASMSIGIAANKLFKKMGWFQPKGPSDGAVQALSSIGRETTGDFTGGGSFLGKGVTSHPGSLRLPSFPKIDLGGIVKLVSGFLGPRPGDEKPGSRFLNRLFQIPQTIAGVISPAGWFPAAGNLLGSLMGSQPPQALAPQIVHRFEKGSVEIHTQKIDAKILGAAFVNFLNEQSRK
jgi:hypothetical protein